MNITASAPQIVVDRYFSIEKCYIVICWKIMLPQMSFIEIQQIAEDLLQFSEDEVNKAKMRIAFPDDDLIMFSCDGKIGLISHGQTDTTEENINELKSLGFVQKSF